MLDAHDASHPQRDLLLDFSDNDELNLWADSQMEAPVTARPIDITDERWNVHGNEDAPLFSTINLTYSPSGLRNRRAGSRRHTPTSSDSLSSHPLQGGSHSASSSVTLDDSITRPSLRRWLSGGGYDEDVGDDPSTDNETVRTSETLVIVHEVSRTDSLAGVALKYGISLVDLRKVNHLWASDTIHLRKVLYIPLHLTSRKYRYVNLDRVSSESSTEQSNSDNTHPSVVVRRVPASELTFFPPPSQTIRSSRSHSGVFVPQIMSSSISSSPQAPSLLQSLQLPSRDLLFPRLSLDSSETSSTANASEASSDQEHEMDVLNSSGKSKRRGRTLSGKRSTTPRSSVSDATAKQNFWDIEMNHNMNAPTTPPYMPLHTEQLKPSPAMELPRTLKGFGK